MNANILIFYLSYTEVFTTDQILACYPLSLTVFFPLYSYYVIQKSLTSVKEMEAYCLHWDSLVNGETVMIFIIDK